MSLVRTINDRNRTAGALENVINYCSRNGKLQSDMINGVGIQNKAVYLQMKVLKKLWHQEDGKQYQHIVVSCDSALDDKDTACKIGVEIAQFFDEYQTIVYTHTDTNNLHSHLIINTVNAKTGKKLALSRTDFHSFIQHSNEVFMKNGLPAIGEKNFQGWSNSFSEDDMDFDDYDDSEDSFDEILQVSKELEKATGITRVFHFEDEEQELMEIFRYINRVKERKRWPQG